MDAVLVTGCSTGLGQEIALHLAGQQFRVFAAVRDPEQVPAVREQARARGVALEALRLDVTDPASIEEAVSQIESLAGPLFGLVNNAGIGLRGCFEDLSEAEIRHVFEVNVFGTMAVTRRVLPQMRKAGRGRIVTISSVGGRIATFGLSAYCATKFALEGFGEALALELAPLGLHSVLIEPGIIPTTRWSLNRGLAERAFDPESPYSSLFQRHEQIALKRAETSRNRPEHVARVIHQVLTTPRPRLRYVVGQPAGLAVFLRRHLPERVFERLYFGSLLKQLTAADADTPPTPTAVP